MKFKLWITGKRMARVWRIFSAFLRRHPILNALWSTLALLLTGAVVIASLFALLSGPGFINYEAERYREITVEGNYYNWRTWLDVNESEALLFTTFDNTSSFEEDYVSQIGVRCSRIILPNKQEIALNFMDADLCLKSRMNEFRFLDSPEKIGVINSPAEAGYEKDANYPYLNRLSVSLMGGIEISGNSGCHSFTFVPVTEGKISMEYTAKEGDELHYYDEDYSLVVVPLEDGSITLLGDEEFGIIDMNFIADVENMHQLDMNIFYQGFQSSAMSIEYIDSCTLTTTTGSLEYTALTPQPTTYSLKNQNIRFQGKWEGALEIANVIADDDTEYFIVTGPVADVLLSGRSLTPTFRSWLNENYSVIAVSITTSILGGVLLSRRKKEK